MKRTNILILILSFSFLTSVWAQPPVTRPRFGKQGLPLQLQNVIHEDRGDGLSIKASEFVKHDLRVWDLGTYPGGSWSWVNDINDFGVVVGWSMISGPDQQHPAIISLFGPNALQWVDLGTLGGEAPPGVSAEAFGISDTGIVVGHAFTSEGSDHAFVWTARTGMADLGTVPGYLYSQALDINKIGTLIVGWSYTDDPAAPVLPVYWTPSLEWRQRGPVLTWEMHTLDTTVLGAFPYGTATAVNNRGQILGAVWDDSGTTTGVVWSPAGKGWSVKPFYGTADDPNPWPAELNDSGEVVGTAYAADWVHGFAALWKPVGPRRTYKLVRLPNPWGLSNGDGGIGINNRGDIVGAAVYDDYGSARAAYWTTKDPTLVELMPLMDLDWSYSANVNEFGVAAAVIGGGDVMHGMAVQLH